ncbi:MAG TPA: CPBP family intramembrane glutamic endopeptidase [Thermoanaerobaculia bacterium]|nr:CPBP family intramembrane glutamic endopeptidase [Thermoanaerobaculia bacterium]
MLATLRLVLPILLSMTAVVAIDRAAARRGRQLPGLEVGGAPGWAARRVIGLGALGLALYLGVFAPLGTIGIDHGIDLSQVSVVQLFVLHAVFAVALVLYLGSGLWRPSDSRRARSWREELGVSSASPAREVGLGLASGLLGWGGVILLLSLLAALVVALGGEQALPSSPPPMIVFVAGLPWGLRLLLSLSAGLVEEAFFRGLLQPRIGIIASSVLFVLAHVSYDQPFLLIGVTVLSFGLAVLTRWRRTIWPAVVAHAVFDAIQLLVIIPIALRLLESGGS